MTFLIMNRHIGINISKFTLAIYFLIKQLFDIYNLLFLFNQAYFSIRHEIAVVYIHQNSHVVGNVADSVVKSVFSASVFSVEKVIKSEICIDSFSIALKQCVNGIILNISVRVLFLIRTAELGCKHEFIQSIKYLCFANSNMCISSINFSK